MFMKIASEMKEASVKPMPDRDESLLKQFASCAAGDLAPMQSVIGGIASQEVMKVKLYCNLLL